MEPISEFLHSLHGERLQGLIQWGGFALMFAIVFAETGLLAGFFLPGDSLLFTAGAVIGSAGPTTAMRLDPYTEPMLELGVKGIIGKGGRGPSVRAAIARNHAVYCIAVGGTGALLNRHIKSASVVAFEDLGTEAIRRLEVEGFPAIVVNDCRGGDLLEQGKKQYRTSERPIPAVQSLGG